MNRNSHLFGSESTTQYIDHGKHTKIIELENCFICGNLYDFTVEVDLSCYGEECYQGIEDETIELQDIRIKHMNAHIQELEFPDYMFRLSTPWELGDDAFYYSSNIGKGGLHKDVVKRFEDLLFDELENNIYDFFEYDRYCNV